MPLQMVGFPSFLWLNTIPFFIYRSHRLCPVISWQTLRLFLCLDYSRYCHKHRDADNTSIQVISFSMSICPVEGLLYHMTVLFLIFLRNLQMIFHMGYINLHSQKCTRISFSPHPGQHLPFVKMSVQFFYLFLMALFVFWHFMSC